MRALVALIAPLSLLLAGCVATSTPSDGVSVADAASEQAFAGIRALMADVPCEASVGKGTSDNLLKLDDLAFEDAAHGEIDIRGDLAVVARYQVGGLFVVDLSDPANLSIVGQLDLDETRALDVKFTSDGQGALIGDFGRVHLVDVSDPANPVLMSTFEYKEHGLSGQAHMVLPVELDGVEYVYVATQTGRQPLHVLQRDGWNLTLAGSYHFSPVVASDPALGNHDIAFYHDEILDKPMLFVAEGLLGWSALDLSDPVKPVRVGGSLSLEPGAGYTHTVRVMYTEGGQRLVVTMAEVGVNTLKVYDATNLQAPVLLARWNADATRPHIPQHNIQIQGDWLHLAHYTEGLYVFNLTALGGGPPLVGTLTLAPAAHFAVEDPQGGGALGFANVWDISVSKGILYINDMSNGMTSIGFGCILPGDEAAFASR